MECRDCVHKRVCDLWRREEYRDASYYVTDCFEPKIVEMNDKKAVEYFKELLNYCHGKKDCGECVFKRFDGDDHLWGCNLIADNCDVDEILKQTAQR